MSSADAWRLLARSSPAGLGLATDKRFRYPAHLELLDDVLVRTVAGELPPRVVVEMPPRHGKSETASKLLPAWFLGTFPDRRVILCSYEADFAASWGRKARTVLEQYGRQAFGVSLRSDSKAANRWDIAGRRGGMMTAGVGGPITGKGAELLVIDDPVKNAEEAASEVMRAKHWDWYQSTAYSRLEPGGIVVVIMTRWNEDDLVGRLLTEAAEGGEQWTVVRLPALAEPDDLLSRDLAEPLWPERYDAERLAAIRRVVGSYYWSALYQQSPTPDEGMIFLRSWWQHHDEPPPFHELVTSWDMAFKDTDGSDYVVGQVWGRDLANKHLVCQIRARMEFTETLKAVKALRRWTRDHYPEHASHGTLIEDKANGPAVISSLRRQVPGLIAVEPEGSKEARARAIAPEVEAGNVHLPRGVIPAPKGYDPTPTEVFVNEAAGFPNAANDDQVDAMGQALRRLAGRSASKVDVRTGGYRAGRFDDR